MMVSFDWRFTPPSRGPTALQAIVAESTLHLLAVLIEAMAEHGPVACIRRGGWPGHLFLAPLATEIRMPERSALLLELSNGTLAVREDLAPLVQAPARPRVSQLSHACGYTAGPDYGSFGFAFSAADLSRKWADLRGFMRALAAVTPPVTQRARLGDYAA